MLSKKIAIFLIILVVSYGAVLIAQLWFDVFSPDIFIKISATFFIVAVSAGIALAIFRDVGEEDKNKKKKLVD